MTEPARILHFYFDYLSSNAYLMWERLPQLRNLYSVAIEPVPVLFAGLLEAHGQLGPAEILPKALWMSRNNLRKAALLELPLHPPVYHPFNPLLALRISSLPMDDSARSALISGLFRGVWAEGLHVSEEQAVEAIANAAGLDGPARVQEAQGAAAKRRLHEQTDEAIAAGVFGVPSVRVGDELFWGYDDLPYLELFLAGRDPLDPERAKQWLGPRRPSAERRRIRSRLHGA